MMRRLYLLSYMAMLFLAWPQTTRAEAPAGEPLFKFHKDTGRFDGLTPAGMQKLREQAALVRDLYNVHYPKRIQGHPGLIRTMFSCFMGKGDHILLSGPGGGGKSKLARLPRPSWEMQFSETTTPMALVGGLRTDAAMTGAYAWNFEGSLADPNANHGLGHRIALGDELANTQPETLRYLYEMMNEGSVSVGNRSIKVALRNLIGTSNLDIGDILLKFFTSDGTYKSGRAFLDRFRVKALMSNRSPALEMQSIMAAGNESDWYQLRAKVDPTYQPDADAFEPELPSVDWEFLGNLAGLVLIPTEQLNASIENVIRKFGDKAIKAMADSEKAFATNRREERVQYHSTFQFSNRSTRMSVGHVQRSLLVDILLSELGAPEYLDSTFAQEIPIWGDSAWRVQAMASLQGRGDHRLTFRANGDNEAPKWGIAYTDPPDALPAIDETERKVQGWMARERADFSDEFGTQWEGFLRATEVASMFQTRRDWDPYQGGHNESLELILMNLAGQR